MLRDCFFSSSGGRCVLSCISVLISVKKKKRHLEPTQICISCYLGAGNMINLTGICMYIYIIIFILYLQYIV